MNSPSEKLPPPEAPDSPSVNPLAGSTQTASMETSTEKKGAFDDPSLLDIEPEPSFTVDTPLETVYKRVEAMDPTLFLRLERYIRSRVPRYSFGEPEDILMETTLAVLGSFYKYTFGSVDKLQMVSYGIAAHKVADAVRHLRRRKDEPAGLYDYERSDVDEDTPLGTILTLRSHVVHIREDNERMRYNFLVEVINAAKCQMREAKDRRIIDLIIWDPNIKSEELATALGTTNGSARVAKTRALNRLKDELRIICEHMNPNDMQIRNLKRLLSQKEAQTNRRLGTYNGPRISPVEQREGLARELQASRDQGERQVTLSTPLYIGSLSVAGHDISKYIADYSHSRPRIGIAYPHTDLLPHLRGFIGRIIDPGQLSRLVIKTPKDIAAIAEEQPFDYLAAPYGTFVPEQVESLVSSGGFLLHLCQLDNHPPEGVVTHRARTYREMGVRKVIWDQNESVRYLQEYQLVTGQPLTLNRLKDLSAAGEGPSDILAVKKVAGSWAALVEEAYGT